MVDHQSFASRCGKAWAASKGWLAVVFGVTTVGLIIVVVIQAAEILQPHTKVIWGSLTEALAAFGTLMAVGVALWQSIVIRRQADKQLQVEQHAARVERYLRDAQALAELNAAVHSYASALAGLVVAADQASSLGYPGERIQKIAPAQEQIRQTRAALNSVLQRLRVMPRNPHISSAINGIYGHFLAAESAERGLRNAVYDGDRIDGSGMNDIITALILTMVGAETAFTSANPDSTDQLPPAGPLD